MVQIQSDRFSSPPGVFYTCMLRDRTTHTCIWHHPVTERGQEATQRVLTWQTVKIFLQGTSVANSAVGGEYPLEDR